MITTTFPSPQLRAAAFGLVSSLLALLASCSGPVIPGSPLPPDSAQKPATAELASGDVLRFSFPGATELDLTQKIRSNGRISLPMLGELSIAGKTVKALQSELEQRYAGELNDPRVVVSMVTRAASIYVQGEVLRPGKILLDRPLTALEAVGEAGGLSNAADATRVAVVRVVGDGRERYNLDLSKALSGQAPPFYLKPSDVITVGQRSW